MSSEDVAMFEVDTPVVKTPPRSKGSSKPRWSKYRPKNPIKCDDCMLVLALAEGVGPVARFARHRRVQDGHDLLLCSAHAQDRRDEDGLARLEYD